MNRWRVGLAAAVAAGVFAVAPPFSGVALAATLVVAAVIVGRVVVLPRPARGTRVWGDVGWQRMQPWLWWVLGFAIVEVWTLVAGDELAWPTFSAISDPAMGHGLVRAGAGAAWVAAGCALVGVLERAAPPPRQPHPWWRMVAVVVAMSAWAAATLTDGAWWVARDAPLNPAPGVDNLPPQVWPWTAWLTIAAFALIVVVPLWLHLRARRGAGWADLPSALSAAGATTLGRWVAVGWWWWSGWHFLAR